MKIRDGHVSNSSSSSFVVAFPKKPKSVKDVHQFMFNGKEGGVGVEYYEDGFSYRQVAQRVFDDIKMGNVQTSKDNLLEEFACRYDYSPNLHGGGTHWFGGFTDDEGGSWPQTRDRYFMFDDEQMKEFKEFVIAMERRNQELRDMESSALSRVPEVKYAYKGGEDWKTKKPFTEDEVKAYHDYSKKLEKFKKTNEDYLAYEAARRTFWDEKYQTEKEIQLKIAATDLKNFLDDNKGAFIFIVSYGDESGEGVLEHGDIFRKVPHIRVSHH